MTPDKNQNINLLPADLQRKQQVVRQAITNAPVEYTAAANGKKPPAPPAPVKIQEPTTGPGKSLSQKTDFLSAKPAAGAGHWWQSLFSKKPAKPTAVLTLKAQSIKPLAPAPAPPKPVSAVATSAPTLSSLPSFPTPPTPPSTTPADRRAGGDKSAKKSSEAFDVNLLSGEYAQAFAPQNQKFVFITSVAVTAFIIILGYAGVYLYQLSKEASTRSTAQINEELKKTIDSYAPLEAEDTSLQKKVAGIKSLLAGHVSFKDFLGSLEAATIPEVTYTAIAVSKSGAMSLTALATDYTALARQLAILQKDTPWVKTAIVTGATLARDNQAHSRGVEFEISIKVDPAVFKPTAQP